MGNLPPSQSRSKLKQCLSSHSSSHSLKIGRESTHAVGVINALDTVEIQSDTVDRAKKL